MDKRIEESRGGQTAELEVQYRLLQAILHTVDLQQRLKILLEEMLGFAGLDKGAVYLTFRDRLLIKTHKDLPEGLLAEISDLALGAIPWVQEKTLWQEGFSKALPQAERVARRYGIRSWLWLPLRVEGRLLGAVVLFASQPEAFSKEKVESLEKMADSVSLAVENARLYNESQERLARLVTLREIDRAISANLSLDDIIQVVLEKVIPHMAVDAVGVSLMDWERKRTILAHMLLPSGVRIEGEAFELSNSLLDELGIKKAAVVIYDLQSDPRVQNHRELIHRYNLRSYIGIPLVVQDEAIGVLHLFTTEPRIFDQEDLNFFATLAGQAAISVQNARLYNAALRRLTGMETLAGLTLQMQQYRDEEEMARHLLLAISKVTGVGMAAYFSYDEDSKMVRLTAHHGFKGEREGTVSARFAFPLGEEKGVVGLVAYTRKPLYLPDAQKDSRWVPLGPPIHSAYFLPLFNEDHLFGVCGVFSQELDGLSREQRALGDTFASYASMAMENAWLHMKAVAAAQDWQDTFDSMMDMVYIVDRDFTILRVNKSTAQTLRIKPEEFLTKKCYQIFHNLDHPIEVCPKVRVEKTGEAQMIELKEPFLKKTLLISCSPLEEHGGQFGRFVHVVRDVTEQRKVEGMVQQLEESLAMSFYGVTQAIAKMVEARDPYTSGHAERVSEMAVLLAQEMGLSGTDIEGIRVSGILHDIGKVSVPAELLTKPTKLTDLEVAMVQKHPLSGYEVLKDIKFPWPVAEAILQHHERLDGSGYPEGLRGAQQIGLYAQILAVADVMEAMSAHRPYRAALGLEAAVKEIKKGRGTSYSPEVVDACLRLIKSGRWPEV